ncbi:MAG: DUF4173 domain-containing protein [Gemmatimonadota bacterium]
MMQGRMHAARLTLVVAALLGICGELLLRVEPWGINALLAALALGAGLHVLRRRLDVPLTGTMIWLHVAVPVLAAVLAWRASPPLVLMVVAGVLLALVSAALAAHGRALSGAVTWDVVAEGVATGIYTALGVVPLMRESDWSDAGPAQWHTTLRAVARGALLAIPPLIVFGGLFIGADAAFEAVVSDALAVVGEEVLSHILFGAFLTWIAAGYLHWIVLNDGGRVPRGDVVPLRLGGLEVTVALGMVATLFVAFIAVQFRYLFGGGGLVLETTGLTYAEYARSGFFQLIMVAFLVLPLLMLGLWLVRDEVPARRRTVRIVAAALVVLVFLIMGSALYRMQLYQDAYGLTLLRFYATAFMAWLALIFLLFAASMLRDSSRHFAAGVIVSAVLSGPVLAAVNPEARIVATNVERARAGDDFDARYVYADLSADAVPGLIAALPDLAAEDRCAIAHWLVERWGAERTARQRTDWRTWNQARVLARRSVREHEPMLRILACAPTETAALERY